MRTVGFQCARYLFMVVVGGLANFLAADQCIATILSVNSMTPTGNVRFNGPYMIGYDFTVGGSEITIDSIGVEDILNSSGIGTKSYGDGTFTATQVGIWNSGGMLLGSATVKSAKGSPIIDGFRYERLASPITLQVGQTYTIGAQKGDGVDYFFDNNTTANYSSGAGISLATPRFNLGAGFAKPTDSGGTTNGRWSGGNATEVNTPPVDTPALFSWAGVGTTLEERNNFTGSVGYKITTGDNRMSVSALGFFDHNRDGLASSHQVGIWDATGSTMLATVTVAAGTVDPLYEFFRYHDLPTPLTLEANTSYLIAAEVTSGGDIWYNNSVSGDFNPSLDPTYAGFSVDAFGQFFPSSFAAPTSVTPASQYFLAANVLATIIPEPLSLSMLGMGGAVVIAFALRRRRIGKVNG